MSGREAKKCRKSQANLVELAYGSATNPSPGKQWRPFLRLA